MDEINPPNTLGVYVYSFSIKLNSSSGKTFIATNDLSKCGD